MKSVLTTITPEMAKKWIDTANVNNRSIRKSVVSRYARDMENDRWQVNGDAIRFSSNDNLLDGQHRLMACIQANYAFSAYVITGLDESSYLTIDRACQKTFADALAHGKETNTHTLSAALRWIVLAETQGIWKFRSATPTESEMEDALLRHPGIRQAVNGCGRINGLPQSFIAFYRYVMDGYGESEKFDEFVKSVSDGQGLYRGDPAYQFREFITAHNASLRKAPKDHVMAMFLKAWNLYRCGKKAQSLRFRDGEAWPEIPALVQLAEVEA
jgi:hypothetical protein